MTEEDAKCFARTIILIANCGDEELEDIARDILDRLFILQHRRPHTTARADMPYLDPERAKVEWRH